MKTNTLFTAYQSKSTLIIRTGAENIGKVLHLYNAEGKLLRDIVIEKPETSVDISNLMDGVYVLKLDETGIKVHIRQ